jgi:nicotinamide-nucleotide amidase
VTADAGERHPSATYEAAAEVLAALTGRGWTIAVAESLTGGLATSALVDVPGASAAVRGGVVAYSTEVKRDVLGVDAGVLAAAGAVDATVARQMADGVRRLLGADVGLSTTGVAGPDPQDGQPVGTVWIAVVTPSGESTMRHAFDGDRPAIRRQTVAAALTETIRQL